jgi:hypothetical protein
MLTPQGLKIRLDSEFCEQLHLKNDITINDLLKEFENFVCTAKWLIFIAGIIAFIFRYPNNSLFVLSLVIIVICSLASWIHPIFMVTHGIFTKTQPRIFVTIAGWFIDKIVLIILGLLTVGWKGLLYYAGGYIIATALGYIFNIFLAKSNFSRYGVALQSDENSFIFLSLKYMERVSYMDWIKSYYGYLSTED